MDGLEEKIVLCTLKRGSVFVTRGSYFLNMAVLIFGVLSIAHASECSVEKINSRTQSPENRTPIFIFVSFSMPEQSLKQFAVEAKKAGASLILRGLVNNSMKETVARLQPIVQETKASVLIDPTLYRRFKIDKVPAVVVSNLHEPRFDVLYGQTTLDYALQQIAEKGEAASTAREPLKRLRGSS